MSRSSYADRILFFGTAMLLVGVGVLMEIRVATHYATYLVVPGIMSILAGGVFAGAYLLPRGRLRGLLRSLTIMGLNTAVLLGLVEGSCHVARVDFNSLLGVREKSEAFPIYFRMPADPTGEVFFKRSGPESWTGRPLSVFLKNNRGTDLAYEEEVEVTIQYDGDGFRNPADLTDWEIAVAGDSFTESGYLEAPDLFT
ncbi:MAG: hypothetical protein P8J87_08095, partial [Verrucomicrobiales bacterium]|nr:hypothetical protein [Verrucomicrobiales bacterium]